MENPNFTIIDIRKILRSNYKNIFWTGKIYDEKLCDYKDLEIKDFNNRSMHSFLFIDKKTCVMEKDIQISNSNFKIYSDDELSTIEKDLTKEWLTLITKNTTYLNI